METKAEHRDKVSLFRTVPLKGGQLVSMQSQSCSLIMTYMYDTKGDWEQWIITTAIYGVPRSDMYSVCIHACAYTYVFVLTLDLYV